jgi:protein HIRA/HIR1
VYNIRQTVKLATPVHLRPLPPIASLESPLTLSNGSKATLRCVVVEQRLGAQTGVTLSSLGSVLWRDRIEGRVCAATGTGGFVAVAVEDGGVFIYTMAAGRRIVPRVELGGGVAFMTGAMVNVGRPEQSGASDATLPVSLAGPRHLLLLISSDCRLLLWDLARLETTATTSLLPLIDTGNASTSLPAVAIASASIAPSGQPVVVLSTGTAATWHAGLQCWVRIAGGTWGVSAYRGARVGDGFVRRAMCLFVCLSRG